MNRAAMWAYTPPPRFALPLHDLRSRRSYPSGPPTTRRRPRALLPHRLLLPLPHPCRLAIFSRAPSQGWEPRMARRAEPPSAVSNMNPAQRCGRIWQSDGSTAAQRCARWGGRSTG
ncbi:unnamed protein product [Urochloa humidicola]